MSYKYEIHRPYVFTEEGVKNLMKVRDRAKSLLIDSGAVRAQELITVGSGDSWDTMALIDYLVETGTLREVPRGNVVWQHRVFV